MEPRKYNQMDYEPVPKVKAVAAAGAIVTLVITVLALFGVIVPDNISSQAEGAIAATVIVVSFIQSVVVFAAGYLKRDEKQVAMLKEMKSVTKKKAKV